MLPEVENETNEGWSRLEPQDGLVAQLEPPGKLDQQDFTREVDGDSKGQCLAIRPLQTVDTQA